MTKYAAKGTMFQSETATPDTYQDVAQVRGISPAPSMSADAIDVSCMESAAGASDHWREFVAGFKDAGELSIDMLFDPVEPTQDQTAEGLLSTFVDGVVRNFQIIWPDTAGTIWRFSALVTGYEPTAPLDEALTASVTFKLTGAPVFAAV